MISSVNKRPPRHALRNKIPWHILGLLVMLISACTPLFPQPSTSPSPNTPQPTPLPEALITFRVQIPEALQAGETLQISFLDEVTGLALNPTNTTLKADDSTHYSAILPFALHSVLKYRYLLIRNQAVQEHISDGRAVRYRMYRVDGPGLVQDVVSRWTDTDFSGPTGRITGQVTDAKTTQPIPSVLIAAGGAQTFSSADGTYLLEGLPPGTHNLVAYALDGSYRTFQQGAVVAAESTTPAPIVLEPAQNVSVIFTLIVPPDTVPALPIRLAGNLFQLGNTFADLTGGVNTLASRMPALTPQSDGRYYLTLNLPAGTDLRYKYTMGDGLWNAERTSQGGIRVRQLIVLDSNLQLVDQVEAWENGKSAPITFDITVPAHTPPGDNVAVQFNPGFGWTEAIPMLSAGNNRWIYVLSSPLDITGSIRYRFCRNEQCGSADDLQTAGPNSQGHFIRSSLLPQMVVDPVKDWVWLPPKMEPVILPDIPIVARGANFIAGVEFQPGYHPSWKPRMPSALGDVRSLNSKWITLSPTWTFTRNNLPVLEPVPSQDVLWANLVEDIQSARSQGLHVSLFPTTNIPGGSDLWWSSASRDFSWWQVWFERYRTFILHYADVAAKEGVSFLVIGGEWIAPALPGGTLSDGSASGVPEDAEMRWRALISEIRNRYKGTLLWAIPFQSLSNPPAFLDSIDQIYVLWSEKIAKGSDASEEEMKNKAGKQLDEILKPLQAQIGKPVILGIAYPSADGGATGCLPSPNGKCLDLNLLSRPNPDIPTVTLDLQEQVNVYDAMMIAINERDWISGIISRGYYPPAVLQDKSTSIHGKPAQGVVWHWYKGFLGIP